MKGLELKQEHFRGQRTVQADKNPLDSITEEMPWVQSKQGIYAIFSIYHKFGSISALQI